MLALYMVNTLITNISFSKYFLSKFCAALLSVGNTDKRDLFIVMVMGMKVPLYYM